MTHDLTRAMRHERAFSVRGQRINMQTGCGYRCRRRESPLEDGAQVAAQARCTSPAGRSPGPHLNEHSAPVGFAHRRRGAHGSPAGADRGSCGLAVLGDRQRYGSAVAVPQPCRLTCAAALAGALPGQDDAPGHERGYRLGPVLLAGPGPGRAVGYRAAGPGDRDQLRPFPHGRRLPAAPVPVRCRAGLPLLAASAAGGCGPGGHGRDLPAPGARARAAVEGVKGSAKTCDIHHYPHLPPEAAGRPCASRPWRRTPAPFTGTERGPAAPDTIAGVFGDLTLAEPGLTDVWACTGRLADSNDAYSQTRITLCSVTRPVGPQRIVRFSVTRATTP